VLCDAPPLLAVTDAAILAKSTSGAILIVSSGKPNRHQLSTALEALQTVGAKVAGVAMTMLPTRGPDAYYGQYGGYGQYGYKKKGAHVDGYAPVLPATNTVPAAPPAAGSGSWAPSPTPAAASIPPPATRTPASAPAEPAGPRRTPNPQGSSLSAPQVVSTPVAPAAQRPQPLPPTRTAAAAQPAAAAQAAAAAEPLPSRAQTDFDALLAGATEIDPADITTRRRP